MESNTLSPRAVLLIALEAMGGQVLGRTLLQKRMYFVGELLGEDLGFRSHFYGPYSSLVHSEAVQASTLGLLQESSSTGSSVPGERGRVDYSLTEAGLDTAQRAAVMRADEAKQIRKAVDRLLQACGELDGTSLSIAAKVHYILARRSNGHMSGEQIREEALKLRWNVPAEKVAAGVDSLLALKLVEVVESEP